MKLPALPLIPQDKANHFLYGAAAAAFVAVFLLIAGRHIEALSLPANYIAQTAVVCSLLVGLLKERADRKDPEHHTVEWADVRFTVFGGLTVAAPLTLLGVLR